MGCLVLDIICTVFHFFKMLILGVVTDCSVDAVGLVLFLSIPLQSALEDR